MERKLASIKQIKDIYPIENADNIVVALIDGWECIIRKDEYKVGDLCVYFEVDSFLPIRDEYKFLESRCKRTHPVLGEGYRIKTMKLRGVVSNGLVLPIPDDGKTYKVGQDVSEEFGIKKWEDVISSDLSGISKGSFPSYIIKTDEPRCISEGTLIHTNLGTLPIEDVVEFDEIKILSMNEDGNLEFQDMINVSVEDDNDDWYEVELENGVTIITTSIHPFYLPKIGCYREVKDLTTTDELLICFE